MAGWDIKLAIRVDDFGKVTRGMYHEKIGVMHDSSGHFVAFDGSNNETEGGLFGNFERTPVYCSWKDPEGRGLEIKQDFEDLWDNKTRGVQVIPFSDVTASFLDAYKQDMPPRQNDEKSFEQELVGSTVLFDSKQSGRLQVPSYIDLRNYQRDIIDDWFQKNGKGIYSLATGTGKTITALATATRLQTNGQLNALLVLCPYKNLVTQWADELQQFGVQPIMAFESKKKWHSALLQRLTKLGAWNKEDPLVCVVTSYATYTTQTFQDLLPHFPKWSMLIADEAHHIGSEHLSSKLPSEGFDLRLALSATPERHNDEEGSQRITQWFGDILKPEVTVSDAIKMGALCPYEYHAVFVDLCEEEQNEYEKLTQRIAQLLHAGHEFSSSPQLGHAVQKRSAYLATLSGKMSALKEIVTTNETPKMLVYCGAGTRDNLDPEEPQIRHVEEVVKTLSDDLNMVCAKYTAETTQEKRESMLRGLDRGQYDAIVAINCLDEGVDVPSIQTAVLMTSSGNPRQFIQRRGRVLRKSKGKTKAVIYDMVVVPNTDNPSPTEKALMRRELSRYLEFANSAINKHETELMILNMQEKFGLLDM